MLKIAVAQMCSSANTEENLTKAQQFVHHAVAENCQLIAFPELFNYMPEKNKPRQAEDESGPTLSKMKSLAKEHQIYIWAGSMLWQGGENRPHNTTFVIAPSGETLLRYSKLHLFDVDIPDGVTYYESKLSSPGKTAAYVKTDIGCLGAAICYDLRFPELFRFLGEKGAEIIFIPSAFTFATGKYHWEILVRARAIENQVFVVAPNQWGELPNGIRTFGGSLICDPWGEVLAKKPEGEGVITAELDFEKLRKVRREMPVWSHRVTRYESE